MRRFCFALTLLSSLLFTTASVSAGTLPHYDVERYCKTVAQAGGGSNMIYNACIDGEQTAYNDLKGSWASVPPKTARYCDDVARAGQGSYEILKVCIDEEIQAAGDKKGFQY